MTNQQATKQKDFYTDYPFTRLGDEAGVEAPIRRIKLVSYDGNKYVRVFLPDHHIYEEIKWGYIYTGPARTAPVISFDAIKLLPEVCQ